MKKGLLLSSLSALMILAGIGYGNAFAETANVVEQAPVATVAPVKTPPLYNPECKKSKCPLEEMKKKSCHSCENKYIRKAEMEAKRAEFEKRLELTDEQKKQIQDNKIKDREKIKPILEQMRVKHEEYKQIDEDATISAEDKDKKKQQLRAELKELKVKADNCRKENMKNFESLLTEKQKKEFEKIKKEQKKEFEKRKKSFDKKRKEFKKKQENK